MLRLVRDVFCILLFLTTIKSQQCPVSVPTIVSSSSSDNVCAVVSQETLRYICNNDAVVLSWNSLVFSTPITVVASQATGTLAMPVTGVTLTENDNDNTMCLNSTLTFTGTVADLEQLNGVVLTCDDGADANLTDTVTIVIPVLAGPPTSVITSSTTCGSNGNQVTLQWTPPTNTGGQGVVITHYNITGLPQTSCTTGPCDMVDGTITTIIGLQCNDDITVTVSAVNCRGVGNTSDPIVITVDVPDSAAPTFSETPCFDGGNIRVLLMEYTSSCLSNLMFVVSSNCFTSEQVVMISQTDVTMKMLPASADDDCEVTAFVMSDCGNSSETSIMVNGRCPTMIPSSTPSPITPASPHPTTSSITSPTTPVAEGLSIVPAAAGGAIAGIVIAALAVVLTIILVCIKCPPECCMPCRRMCCGCCSEEMICYKCGDGDKDYGEPQAHVEKQPVKETKEKDVETGQPSYPAGPMYQDPNTIQRQAAPSAGDLYTRPEKPARHQKQKPAVEMATYQDPNTIQRQAAPTTGDLYAQPDKLPKQPPGPAPVYSQVDKPQPGGIEYADLSHSEAPPNARRPAPVPDTFYAEVRESRP